MLTKVLGSKNTTKNVSNKKYLNYKINELEMRYEIIHQIRSGVHDPEIAAINIIRNKFPIEMSEYPALQYAYKFDTKDQYLNCLEQWANKYPLLSIILCDTIKYVKGCLNDLQ